MITIQILGLDHFVVGQYSREHTANLAQLFETSEDEISFGSTETVIIHNGVEQTSWNVLVLVHASHQYEPLEGAVASYLLKTLSSFAFHLTVEFDYFEPHAHYASINDKYPLFITSEQVHDITYEEGEEDDDCCDHDHDDADEEKHPDPNNEDEIYLGNAFEGFDEKLAKLEEEKKKA